MTGSEGGFGDEKPEGREGNFFDALPRHWGTSIGCFLRTWKGMASGCRFMGPLQCFKKKSLPAGRKAKAGRARTKPEAQ